jgi:hypothetical protein
MPSGGEGEGEGEGGWSLLKGFFIRPWQRGAPRADKAKKRRRHTSQHKRAVSNEHAELVAQMLREIEVERWNRSPYGRHENNRPLRAATTFRKVTDAVWKAQHAVERARQVHAQVSVNTERVKAERARAPAPAPVRSDVAKPVAKRTQPPRRVTFGPDRVHLIPSLGLFVRHVCRHLCR